MNNLSDFIANQFLVHEMDIYILYRLSINVTTDSRSELHTSDKVNKMCIYSFSLIPVRCILNPEKF